MPKEKNSIQEIFKEALIMTMISIQWMLAVLLMIHQNLKKNMQELFCKASAIKKKGNELLPEIKEV